MESLLAYLLSFEFVRFVGIGGLGTFLYYAIYAPLTYYHKDRYVLFAFIAFAPSLAVTFMLQKYWTFSNAGAETIYLQMTLFLLQRALMFGLNIYVLRLLVGRMRLHPIVAQVASHLILSYPSYVTMQPVFAI